MKMDQGCEQFSRGGRIFSQSLQLEYASALFLDSAHAIKDVAVALFEQRSRHGFQPFCKNAVAGRKFLFAADLPMHIL